MRRSVAGVAGGAAVVAAFVAAALAGSLVFGDAAASSPARAIDPSPARQMGASQLEVTATATAAATPTAAPTPAPTPAPTATPVPAKTAAPSGKTVADSFEGTQKLVITTQPGNTRALVSQLNALGVSVTEEFTTVASAAAVTVTQEQLAAIRARIPAAAVSVDSLVVLFDTQTENPAPWNLDRIDQVDYTPSGTARSYTYPSSAGAGATVFILDSGFIRQNSELDGRVAPGVDLAGGDHGTPMDLSDDTSTKDCNGHGTHVAGTVASTTYGVAKLARIVPVRVFDCSGSTYSSTIVAGIEWVIANRPSSGGAVINMSLGAIGGDTLVDSATQAAINAGITVVVAAGNGGADGFGDDACLGSTNSQGVFENGTSPARVVDAITVGATGYDDGSGAAPSGYTQDLETYFSNYGTCVDILAPGAAIPSLDFAGTGSRTLSGTSMATPLVAGAAALYLATHPSARPAEVQSAVVDSAAKNKVQYADQFWPRYIAGYPSSRATRTPNLLLNISFLNVQTGVPTEPRSLAAGSSTTTTMPLTWVQPSTLNGATILDYLVQYRVSGMSNWSTFAHTATATTGQTVSGLMPGTSYDFQVAARTAQGDSAFSSTVTVPTLTGITSAPRILSAGTATKSAVALVWTAPLTLNGGITTDYVVQFRISGSLAWTTFAHTAKATTGITVSGLRSRTLYQFQVAARTAQGDSVFSNSVTKATG
ncbi:S8 family serine peptidase [Frigoribacterium sp. CG_9.8]|uniref:S8 family serine peptidase n=1 Tax=Frigoribacterium sp. CG_9.8 TaxID=2787733 RepID=UPI0018CA5E93|nr:S8 family serine peptidase [Frigoribacterium sp. CG_9.8]MBG6108835.1 subtilisin family serine protease [Frigoribacterium sp. CG_9.8]